MKLRSYLSTEITYQDRAGAKHTVLPSGMLLRTATFKLNPVADTFGFDVVCRERVMFDGPGMSLPPLELDDGSDGIIIYEADAANLAMVGTRLPYLVFYSFMGGEMYLARHLMQGQEPAGPTWLSTPTQGA